MDEREVCRVGGGGVQGELRGSENNGSVCSGDVGGFSLSAIKARRR